MTNPLLDGAKRGAAFLDEHAAKRPDVMRPSGDPAKGKSCPDKENAPGGDSSGWPAPQNLTAKFAPEADPLDTLPGTIRAAVEEVAGFVQAPFPLVAASALGALSLVCQAHIDVQRAEKLQGPVGLFLLTIADSGERKSTCDGFFTKAIREYQNERAEAMKPVIREYSNSIIN
jgi:putative DNA primase/helicase